MLKKTLYIISFVLLCEASLFAQERFGISNSMYAGISGIALNPSFIAASPYRWDLNIVGAQLYFDNNYVYLDKTNIPKLLKDAKQNANLDSLETSDMTFMVNNAWSINHGKDATYKLMSRDNNSWNKNAYVSLLLQGPSLMFNVKKWTFAITTAGRTAVSVTGLNKDGAKLIWEGMAYDPLHNVDINLQRVRINAMAWEEFGASAAKVVKKVNDNLIKVGVTLKYLKAFEGAYYNFKGLTLNALNDSVLSIKGFNLNCGYAPDQATLKTYGDSTGIHPGNINPVGKGVSVDLGFSIEKKKLSKEYQCPSFCNKALELQYAWKFGMSLIDFGYVHFTKNASRFIFVNKSDIWVNIDKSHIGGISGLDSSFANHFNDSIIDVDKDKFTMMTPWALSAQFDYNIGYNFYVNATWVQRLPHFGLPGVDRANVISITPHYELRRIGVAIPIVMYQYLWPRIGIALRLNNNLVIGTDKIGAFIGNKLSGADVYFALKINMLKKCPKQSESLIKTN